MPNDIVNDELDIPFPNQKFTKYIKHLDIPSNTLLTIDDVKKMFILITADFKNGKVSLDELSSMLAYLWGTLDRTLMRNSELGDVLDAASELSFYVRAAEDHDCADTFIYFLQKVLGYYERIKRLG